ncbi:MAG TPA: YdeI/OmpD-associated family protein [Tepidisphaeraceae bacterium]|jgi:uncharacterized protein YdeI (YjbR/CyaY-like superfamily)|nr:YdeI/OmpD-associated family protein [Tepidisphaeraceae bacterium]
MHKDELNILAFASAGAFQTWLAKNRSKSTGIWLRFFKKASGRKTVTYSEALDAALCYGWIDGLVKSYHDHSYLQRFTPRRPKSLWSKRNRQHAARLIKTKRMQPAGLKAIQAAKRDGHWQAAYDSPSKMAIPKDFLKELSRNARAKAFFATLNKINTYAIAWRLQTAIRPQTREKRMKAILEMLASGKKLH